MRPFHPSYIFTAFLKIVPYIWVTLAVMLATVFFAGLIGLLLARAKIKRHPVSLAVADAYIYIARCIPSIVMLFIVYYGLPELLLAFGININNISKAFFVILTFTLLFAANLAEVFRSAYMAIDAGQREAAVSVGMTELQAFFHIVLPQATVVALPNFTNLLVNLMKEGSLAYTIGMLDVMGKGQVMIGINNGSYGLEIYLALAMIYWIMTIVIEKGFGWIETHFSKGQTARGGAVR